MKRILAIVGVVVMAALMQGVVLAQSNPMIGTWKMNAEKSKYSPAPGPKSLTVTIEAQGDGIKSTSEAVGPDGASTSWSYTANYDGKDNPITGTGAPGGADTAELKRLGANSTLAILKKGGKVLRTGRFTVSKDGKVMKLVGKGKDADGKPVITSLVFDKQ